MCRIARALCLRSKPRRDTTADRLRSCPPCLSCLQAEGEGSGEARKGLPPARWARAPGAAAGPIGVGLTGEARVVCRAEACRAHSEVSDEPGAAALAVAATRVGGWADCDGSEPAAAAGSGGAEAVRRWEGARRAPSESPGRSGLVLSPPSPSPPFRFGFLFFSSVSWAAAAGSRRRPFFAARRA